MLLRLRMFRVLTKGILMVVLIHLIKKLTKLLHSKKLSKLCKLVWQLKPPNRLNRVVKNNKLVNKKKRASKRQS